jgi:parallel beta-helix repeat protein
MSNNTWYLKPVYVMVSLALVLSLGITALPVAQTAEASPGTHYYVSTAGNNTNDGLSQATAWRTITYAVETGCPAGNVSDPNIIHVAAGTYNTSGGENFTIDFEKANVSLIGAGAGNTTIDRETAGTGTILGINATGITVQGFTLDNAKYGIEAKVGGFSVLNNVFSNDIDHDIDEGVYVNIDEDDRATDFSFDDVLIDGNEFYIDVDGVYLLLDVDFDANATGLNATIGDVDILDNVFDMVATDGVDLKIWLNELTGGTVDIGDVDISNGNEFYGGYDAVYFDSWLYHFNSTAVTVGDLMVNDNFFENQTDAAVYILKYYHIYNWRGTTTGTFGDLEISGNNISSDETNSDGIHVEYYAYWGYFDDDASLTAGNVYIEDNDPIDVEEDAIYFHYYETVQLGDDSWITLGDLSIQRNNIDAGSDGMYVRYEDVGYNLNNNSALHVGDTYIVDNDVDAHNYGIYLWLSTTGYDVYDYATVTFGNTTIERNDVYAKLSQAIYVYPRACGAALYGHSAVTMGDINIVDNNTGIVAETNHAIEMYYDECTHDMYDDSMATFGDVNIEGNIIDAYFHGVYLPYERCGYEMYGNSTATWGDVRIVDNDIEARYDAIHFYFDYVAYDLEDNASLLMGDTHIVDNRVASDDNGVYIDYYDNELGSYMEDDSYARLPSYNITLNTFNVTEDGIHFYTYANPYHNSGNATADFGGFVIDDNSFSCDDGIYFYIHDFCETCEDDAVTTMGDVDITDNEFHGLDSEAIYIWYEYLQYDPSDNSTLEVGNLTIARSLIDGASDGIKVKYDEIDGDYNSTTSMGILDITGNEVGNVTGDGIYVYYYLDADDTSTVAVDRALIQGNILDGSSDNGVYMYMYKESDAGATLNLGNPVIDGNTVVNWTTGIYLEDVVNGTIIDNFIKDNGDGIYLEGSDNITILYNNILSNTVAWSGVHLDEDCLENTLVKCNNFMGNLPYGVYTAFATVNAANNWWGCSEGPGAAGCDTVIGNVTYDPWLPMEFQYCPECGGTPPVPPTPPSPPGVPTVNHWGIVTMITLFAGFLVWTVRRRRLAS